MLFNVAWASLLLFGVRHLLRAHSFLRLFSLGLLALLGVATAAVCLLIEQLLFAWIDVDPASAAHGLGAALFATLLFAAPLEEGAKVFAVWPLHTRRVVTTRADALLAALTVTAGFAIYEGVVHSRTDDAGALLSIRLLLATLAHLFFAGCWAYVLGSEESRRWLPITWATATLFHGLFDHIVLVRGASPAIVVPVIASMLALSWIALRSLRRLPTLGEWERMQPPEPELGSPEHRRAATGLKLHWIAIGALVTTGVALTALILAVYAGHRMGLDFAAVNTNDVRANGPLVLLGVSVMAAFPVAGYLVAKASHAPSVLEPAMGTALAIIGALGALSLAAPVAVVFALAVAPVAFALACAGAWFGIER